MALLEDKLIELSFSPHSDLIISWPYFIENSISTEIERGKGHIRVKYSEVPDFVYFLANKIGTDFLPEKILEEAKKENFISFSNENYKEFYDRVKQNLEFKKRLWDLLEDDKAKNQIFDEQLRYLKEKLPNCEYAGFIPSSAEYSSVDILYRDHNLYLAQRKNILRLSGDLSREILKRTVEHYGIVVSPALRPLIEKF